MRQTAVRAMLSTNAAGRAAAWLSSGALAVPLLAGASAALYAINLDRPENPDELYHVLAARGLLETGEPRIADGRYERGYLFTWLVAVFFRIFGESLAVARLPSLIATVCLVVALHLWVRREAGPLAGWLVAGLYAVSPFAVLIAQFSRFYAIQALAFTLGCWAVHELARTSPRSLRFTILLVAAGSLFGLAAVLQPTTYLGLTGLAVWATLVLLGRGFRSADLSPVRRTILLVALAVLVFAVLVVGWSSGVVEDAWLRYRRVEIFNIETEDQFWFYHFWYVLYYPTLWTLTAPLALLAIVRAPLLGGMATVVFAVSFLLNSFAGSKSLRYIAYAQPLLFVIWGLALAALAPALRRAGSRLREELRAGIDPAGRWGVRIGSILVGGAFVSILLVNPFWLRTASVLAVRPLGPEIPDADWRRAAPVLAPLLAEVAVVVDTEELGPLYHLGRHDILFSPSKFGELVGEIRDGFVVDPRTGRPIVATLEALERIVVCYPSGLFLAPRMHWHRTHFADTKVIGLLEDHGEPVALPAESHVHAYVWRHPPSWSPAAECARGPPTSGGDRGE